jgi:cardiolipin synthase A/B
MAAAFEILAHVGYYVAAVLAALLSVFAAGHAILYKRDPRSAVSWVGLIILAPVVGPVLYAMVGVNRIRRRAMEIRSGSPRLSGQYGVLHAADRALDGALDTPHRHLLSLGRYGDRVTRRPLARGNAVRPLVNGDEAYPEMLAAIAGAEECVALGTYIFDNDPAGRRFVDALAAAVRRGVQVRVLIDGVGVRYSMPSVVHLLERNAVPVALFMPTLKPWSAPFWNLRNHRKVLVVDGRIGFTGGMNIRQGHLLELKPRHPVRDLHSRFEGPVVQHFMEAFAEDWAFATGDLLTGPPWFRDAPEVGPVVARGILDGPDAHFELLHQIMLGAVACAQSSIRVMTPYFVPGAPLITALTVAATRGVRVEIVLPDRSNLRFVDWATRAILWQLLKRDCHVYFSPPPFDHSKLMIVDDAWTLLGSANWDARSLRLNFEFDVECYDPGLVEVLSQSFMERRDTGRPVTAAQIDGRPLPARLRDGIARLASPYL